MEIAITGCIVLYKNDRLILLNAINSFLNTDLNVKLYLIDNSPVNDLKDIIEDERVVYTHNPSNPGFGAAHNLIIKKVMTESSYHLILNPDIYFEAGTLELLYNYMESNPHVAHVMPKVLYPNGAIQYLCKTNPTPFDLFARRFLPPFLKKYFKKRMDTYEYKDKDYNQVMHNIPYLSGCFMFIKTNIFEQVGLFDDRIFMYIEDADLTRRIIQVADNAYYPEAVVYHHFEKGSHKNWRLMWYSIHGAFVYFNKWGWFSNNIAR
jgi:GT2 family glycosyltransferase